LESLELPIPVHISSRTGTGIGFLVPFRYICGTIHILSYFPNGKIEYALIKRHILPHNVSPWQGWWGYGNPSDELGGIIDGPRLVSNYGAECLPLLGHNP
jgi:hypothetical protein